MLGNRRVAGWGGVPLEVVVGGVSVLSSRQEIQHPHGHGLAVLQMRGAGPPPRPYFSVHGRRGEGYLKRLPQEAGIGSRGVAGEFCTVSFIIPDSTVKSA